MYNVEALKKVLLDAKQKGQLIPELQQMTDEELMTWAENWGEQAKALRLAKEQKKTRSKKSGGS